MIPTLSALFEQVRAPSTLETSAGLAIYRRSVRNNLMQGLGRSFPMSRKAWGTQWRALVESFVQTHFCQDPCFSAVGGEFLLWLQAEPQQAWYRERPYLLELLHYEWQACVLAESPLEAGRATWSALAWPLAYAWPVHTLAMPPQQPEHPTCLLLWRHEARVRHQVLTPMSYHLALRLRAGLSCAEALQALAQDSGQPLEKLMASGLQACLESWRSQGIYRDASGPL